jgi:zinc transport system permease protein
VTNPLAFDFMRRALVACVVVGAAAPLVGAFVVQRRQSLIGDGMGHVAFAGVGLAALLAVQPVLGALVFALAAAVVLGRGRLHAGGDVTLALVFYGGIALGLLLLGRAGAGLSQLLGFLFGSPLNLDWAQVSWIAALSAAVAAAVAVLYRPLVALAFDEEAARVAGVRTDRLSLALTLLVACMVVSGMPAVGLLLVSAMMVVPVAAAARVARSYRGTMLLGSAIGAGSGAAGLLAAFWLDASPAAAVVLVALAVNLVLAGGARLRRRARP